MTSTAARPRRRARGWPGLGARLNPIQSWAAVHAGRTAILVWIAAAPVVVLTAPSTLLPLLNPTHGGQVPTALLLPLLGAGGVAFAVDHQTPLQLTQATRRVLPWQLGWIAVCLVPAIALAALAAVQSRQITVGAAERNLLLVTASTLAAATVLPPGLATIPALGYDMLCLTFAADLIILGLPTPWWAVALERRSSPAQLLVAVALLALAATLHSHHQARRAGS